MLKIDPQLQMKLTGTGILLFYVVVHCNFAA